MTETNIYRDIAERTGGDVYIGVVGPVRTGKSTFIKRFMNALVMPNIEGEYDRARARDEMPQSAAGRTVMTTEPKFIPDEAVEVTIRGGAHLRVKMVDCVGYLVPGALGDTEDGSVRMVSTPWQSEPMPFAEAAETGKPFAVILNSADPESEGAVALAHELEEKYGAPVALVSCLSMNADDITHILELVLYEFPIREISVSAPGWLRALGADHPLRAGLVEGIRDCARRSSKMGDITDGGVFCELAASDCVESVRADGADLGRGTAKLTLTMPDSVYYRTIGELTGFDIRDEEELISLLSELSVVKREYDKVSEALSEVNERGYGIVMPEVGDLTLEEPEIIRQQGGYGVRLRATAPSVHMIKATIETEINPIVGTEAQSEEMVRYLMREFEDDSSSIWQSNMFGKTLYELVNDGLHSKLDNMPEDARAKLSDTLGRIINEGSGGLICIIL